VPKGVEVQVLSSAPYYTCPGGQCQGSPGALRETGKIPGFAGIFVFSTQTLKVLLLNVTGQFCKASRGAICFVAEETFTVSYWIIKLQQVTAPSAFASSETSTVTM
jgi:hypothetical protein